MDIEYLCNDIDICKDIENIEGESTAYAELGNIYRLLSDYKNSIESFKKAILVNNALKNPYRDIECLELLSKNFVLIDDYESAYICIKKSIDISFKIDNQSMIISCNNLYQEICKKTNIHKIILKIE